MTRHRSIRLPAVLLCLLLFAAVAAAHKERQIPSPPRPGSLPDANRKSAHTLVVCKPTSKPTRAEHADIHTRLRTTTGDALLQAKAEESAWHRNTKLFAKCRFEHIQAAVNAASSDTTIEVLPGVYREEPSRQIPTSASGDNPDGSYSYEYHVAHPNDANLVAILGKANITLEGTGAKPENVLIDVGFAKHVGVRCDRCTGFIVRNLAEQDAREHGIYVVDSDGFIFDRTLGSYNHEYQLFSFASDHGLFTDSEAVGGSDSGLYVGGAPNTPGRINTTVQRCKLHHNVLGFSGTQGNYVRLTQNDVYDNAVGISFDAEADHPNFPLNHCEIVDNDIHDNNFDVYAATSDVPPGGPGYDLFHYPVGTGFWFVGGDSCVAAQNRIWNHGCFGGLTFQNPIEGAASNRNQHHDNVMGAAAGGANGTSCGRPGADFWWDETGSDNCWQNNGTISSDPATLPDCSSPNTGLDPGTKLAVFLGPCLIVDSGTGQTAGPCPFGTANHAPYQNAHQAECGNGVLDRGEDCDPGYGGGGSLPETCESLGHGPGTLGCQTPSSSPTGAFLCMWDTSGCAATGCGHAGATRIRLRNLAAPGGDDAVDVLAKNVAGRTFDPRTEATSVVLRDDAQLYYLGRIPAGDTHWTSGTNRFTYVDPSGTHDGIIRIDLRAAPSFGAGFNATIRVRKATLPGAATARALSFVLRVGDDCWSVGATCGAPNGRSASCRKGAAP